jgi:hypothetical protein
VLVLAVALFAIVFSATAARADGEAGLVVQDGDQVKTYCIPFTGDGITGQDLLKQAGLKVEAFGGSTLAVCAIGQTGCQDASSFTSCFCQCQGGDCTYWAFFTRQYGKGWVYSSLAFNLLKAKDGDLHGWKWGKGGPNSAPVPQDITFEQVCGHAPRGGAAPTLVQTPTSLATTAPATLNPTIASSVTAAVATTVAAETVAVPTVLVTITGQTQATPTSPPFAPEAGQDRDSGGGNGNYLAFAAVAAMLVVAVGGAAVWRARHGR